MSIDSPDTNLLIPYSKLPIYGKRIIVTAPRNYASRLAEQIIYKGGLPILMPTIETCLLESYTNLDNILKEIDVFDWIVFTSRNGIEAFFHRLESLGLSKSVLKNCQLCALGRDAERLLDFCGRVDLVPDEPSPEGLVADLSKHPNIQAQTVLVTAPEVVGIPEPNVVPKLVADLQKLNMKVTRVPTYVTRCLDKNIYETELNLIREGRIDVIAFSSAAEVKSFLNMVNSTTDYEQTVIACFGPYTAANAEKLGVNVSICSKDYSSFAGFVEAIATFFIYTATGRGFSFS